MPEMSERSGLDAGASEFPVAPRELKIELTGACNLGCQFCYLEAGDGPAARQLPEADVFRWIAIRDRRRGSFWPSRFARSRRPAWGRASFMGGRGTAGRTPPCT